MFAVLQCAAPSGLQTCLPGACCRVPLKNISAVLQCAAPSGLQTCSPGALLQAAVDMMRKVLNTVNMDGVIVIGEGEKDEVRGTLGLQLQGALT